MRESWGQIQDITKFRRCRFVRAISGDDLFQGSEAFFYPLEHRWMMVWYMVGLQGWKKRQRVEKRFTRVQIHIPGIERLPTNLKMQQPLLPDTQYRCSCEPADSEQCESTYFTQVKFCVVLSQAESLFQAPHLSKMNPWPKTAICQ